MVRARPIIWVFAKTIDSFLFLAENIPVWRKTNRNTQCLNSHHFNCKLLRHLNSPGMITYAYIHPYKDSEKLQRLSQIEKAQSWYCCTFRALLGSGLGKDMPTNPPKLSMEFSTQALLSLKRKMHSGKLMETWTNLNVSKFFHLLQCF